LLLSDSGELMYSIEVS